MERARRRKAEFEPRLLGRSFRRRRRKSRPVFVGELLGEPEIVVLFRPVEIDLAGAHGLERAFHAERADIDVGEDQGDEENGDDGVRARFELRNQPLGRVETQPALRSFSSGPWHL